MWYLNRGGHLDMNVQDAWMQGVTGKGISVTILDDGIEKSHPDLVANYDPLGNAFLGLLNISSGVLIGLKMCLINYLSIYSLIRRKSKRQ